VIALQAKLGPFMQQQHHCNSLNTVSNNGALASVTLAQRLKDELGFLSNELRTAQMAFQAEEVRSVADNRIIIRCGATTLASASTP
jgi:hypothetical protein